MKNIIRKKLNIESVNPNLINAQYAVRGRIPALGQKIKLEIDNGVYYPFDEIVECNIGNPFAFGHNAVTFNRSVMSCMQISNMTDCMPFNQDVKNRAKLYRKSMKQSVGAYSESSGYSFIRQNIANFIEQRDGYKSKISDLFMTNGASNGIELLIQAMQTSTNDTYFIPLPQYPLYSALLTLNQIQQVGYYLDEENNWQVDVDQLQQLFEDSVAKGLNPKAMVVINPGNPTGQVLTEESIIKIVKFCTKNHLVILADEVYQANVYKQGAKFVSFKKVIKQNIEFYKNFQPHQIYTVVRDLNSDVALVSFHSSSKGLHGECGYRGGYFETVNIPDDVIEQINKLKSIQLCSNINGQLCMDLIVNPPNESNGCLPSTVVAFNKEVEDIYTSLKQRAQTVSSLLNKMDNIHSNEVQGAMYAFPQVKLSQKAIATAQNQGLQPDEFYCMEVLKNTGIVLVPGSGFGQKPDTYHFRTTILILPEEKIERKFKQFKNYNNLFHQLYKD